MIDLNPIRASEFIKILINFELKLKATKQTKN